VHARAAEWPPSSFQPKVDRGISSPLWGWLFQGRKWKVDHVTPQQRHARITDIRIAWNRKRSGPDPASRHYRSAGRNHRAYGPRRRRAGVCKAGADGKLAWAFREPIATLLVDGKTIGRHYAGPSWEHSDGSAVVGKAAGSAPGATANDISWLKLGVTSQRGSGVLSGVTTVQRINTTGGKLEGACDRPGTFRSAPYSADYVFLRKG